MIYQTKLRKMDKRQDRRIIAVLSLIIFLILFSISSLMLLVLSQTEVPVFRDGKLNVNAFVNVQDANFDAMQNYEQPVGLGIRSSNSGSMFIEPQADFQPDFQPDTILKKSSPKSSKRSRDIISFDNPSTLESLAASDTSNHVNAKVTSILHGDGIVANIWIEDSATFDILKAHKIEYLFVDVGNTGPDGLLRTDEADIIFFLDMIESYEVNSGYKFKILAYSEVNTAEIQFTDKFADNMVDDYARLVELGFDGVMMDVEPVKFADRDIYLRLLADLKTTLPSNSLITVYAGSLVDNTVEFNPGSENEYEWNHTFYKSVSELTDIIVMQGYDTGIEDADSYIAFLKDQINKVNSEEWKSYFLLGIPTHNPDPENIGNALLAYYSETQGRAFPQNNKFLGVSIFSEWTIQEPDWDLYAKFSEGGGVN